MNDTKQAILDRVLMLGNLGEDHGGEGEKEPREQSFINAKEFIEAQRINQKFAATIDSDGQAVFEFHGNGSYEYADMTFLDSGEVSCYWKGRGDESKQFDAHHTSEEVTVFFQNLVG